VLRFLGSGCCQTRVRVCVLLPSLLLPVFFEQLSTVLLLLLWKTKLIFLMVPRRSLAAEGFFFCWFHCSRIKAKDDVL